MEKKLKYICLECKAKYESAQGSTPYIIAWNDGHFCKPRLVGEIEIKKLTNKTKELAKDDIWITYYN